MQTEDVLGDEKPLSEKDEIVKKCMSTERGKVDLGNHLAKTAKGRLAESLSRKILSVSEVNFFKEGETYDPGEVVAVQSNGAVPERTSSPSDFEIPVWATVPIRELRENRFQKIDAMLERATQDMANQECCNLLSILDVVAESNKVHKHDSVAAGVDNALSFFKEYGHVPSSVLMSDEDFEDSGIENGYDDVPVYSARFVPRGMIYVLPEPSKLGKIEITQDLEAIPADDPLALKIGFVFSQIIRMYIFANACVVKSLLSSSPEAYARDLSSLDVASCVNSLDTPGKYHFLNLLVSMVENAALDDNSRISAAKSILQASKSGRYVNDLVAIARRLIFAAKNTESELNDAILDAAMWMIDPVVACAIPGATRIPEEDV